MATFLIDSARHDNVKDHFHIGKRLGKGSFSIVYEGTSTSDGSKVALKVISKAAVGEKTSMLVTEVRILQAVEHENVIQLRDIFESDDEVILVMEVVTGGELFDRVVRKGCLAEAETAGIIRQVLSALAYLHARNIVHRDLKPENLLFTSAADDALVKIADFGLSTVVDDSQSALKTACGTPGYVAPEVLAQIGYGAPADMWSVGVIMYILLCGFPPFYDENINVLFEQIMAGDFDYPSPYWDGVSDTAISLIDSLLVVDPDTRLTAEQALQHPWLAPGVVHNVQIPKASSSQASQQGYKSQFKRAILARLAIHKFASSASILLPNEPDS